MKLLYIHNTALESQKSNMIQVLYMCDAFKRLGVDVTLALPGNGKPLQEETSRKHVESKIGKPNQYPIITFPRFMIRGRLQGLGGYWGAKRLLSKYHADFYFVRSPHFYNITTELGLPTIYESHNYLLHNRYKILDRFWRRRLLKASQSKTAKLFISISTALTNYWIAQGVKADLCLSLHDGIDFEAFKVTEPQSEAKKKLGLQNWRKIAVYAGSMYQDRGIENILKLAKLFPQVLFLILGGPEHRQIILEKNMVEMGIKNVEFKGWVEKEQVRHYLFAADILLLLFTKQVPTINYCSPLKMFEYMASGRIIVGQAFPTIKEVLVDAETALLADPDSFDQLCLKMQEALNEEYPSKIANRAREVVLTEYTWQSRANSILERLKN